MTFVVPFDGSDLATAALTRATAVGEVLDESVVVISVVRAGNAEYAREKGWLGDGEPFDEQRVVSGIREQVERLSPSADFRHTVVGRYAMDSEVGQALRRLAKEADATVVFVGSDNAGRIVSSLSSVGTNVATDTAYDVHIVRSTQPIRNPVVAAAAEASAAGRSTPE